MEERSGGPSRGADFWLAAALFVSVALPILYVLSVGPAVALVNATGVGHEAAEVFYAPVIWLHNNTPLRGVLE